jgi:predicted DNA-binding mobile mystery protein A
MAVGQSTICDLERSEVRDTIKLDSLRRAADALECDLIYFLVPRTTLDTTVRAQARHKARQHLASAAHILRNKGTGQDVTDDVDAAELDELVLHFADRRGLWSESSAPR